MVAGKCVSNESTVSPKKTSTTTLGGSSVVRQVSTPAKVESAKVTISSSGAAVPEKEAVTSGISIETRSTPNTANPNTVISEDSIKAIREKITIGGGISVSSQNQPRTAIYDNIDAKRNLGGSSGTTVVSGKAIVTPTITPAYKPFPVTEAKPVTKVDDDASGYRYTGTPLKQ